MDSFSCLETERKRNENRTVGENAYKGTKKVIWFWPFDAVDVKSHQKRNYTSNTCIRYMQLHANAFDHYFFLQSALRSIAVMCFFLLIFFVSTKQFFFFFFSLSFFSIVKCFCSFRHVRSCGLVSQCDHRCQVRNGKQTIIHVRLPFLMCLLRSY